MKRRRLTLHAPLNAGIPVHSPAPSRLLRDGPAGRGEGGRSAVFYSPNRLLRTGLIAVKVIKVLPNESRLEQRFRRELRCGFLPGAPAGSLPNPPGRRIPPQPFASPLGRNPCLSPSRLPPVFLVKRDGGACVDLARRVKQPRI